jgi:hypothetical protein
VPSIKLLLNENCLPRQTLPETVHKVLSTSCGVGFKH